MVRSLHLFVEQRLKEESVFALSPGLLLDIYPLIFAGRCGNKAPCSWNNIFASLYNHISM